MSNEKSISLKKRENKDPIYFIILYQRNEKENINDLVFNKYDTEPPKIMYTKEIIDNNGIYHYEKILKIEHKPRFKAKKDSREKIETEIEFEIGKDIYMINLMIDDKSFYYNIILKKGIKLSKFITKENIEQNSLNYFQKLEIFIAALKQNKEEEKIDCLYQEAIKFYSKKESFYLLILLFINIYEKQKLCQKLLEEFYILNKDIEFENNIDRKDDLNKYISTFYKISTEADNIIRDKYYNPIHFYGIILCYLNYYDYEYFKKFFKELLEKNREILFEILLIYNSNILNPIIQDIEFFENFIGYTINKTEEFYIFENSVNYILDIETFIEIINNNKELIIKKYGKSDFEPIQINSNLKINKTKEGKEIKNIMNGIESIINFSENVNILLIYFNSNFWKNILKYYNEPNALNIDICYKLRKLLKKYYDLIEYLFKNTKKGYEKKILNNIKRYIDIDEFAYTLDKNVKIFIEKEKENNKEFSNEEILGYFTQYNPYFIEERYKDKVDTFIFDYVDFNSIDEQFIETFKHLNFEYIFKDNLNDFLNKMMSKINDTFTFGIIIDLINIKRIKYNNKHTDYFNQLKQKYEYVIRKEIISLKGEKLEIAIKIMAKFIKLLYDNDDQKKTIEFLKILDKVDKRISPLVFNELVISCQDDFQDDCQDDKYTLMRDYIYKKFLSDLSNIDNIIKLIDGFREKEHKNKFLKELIKECKFTKDEFYSTNPNPKIELLCELFEKGKINILYKDDNGFADIEETLDKIAKDLDGDITKQKLEEFLSNDEKIVIKRLKLIQLIIMHYNPNEVYHFLKIINEKINKDIYYLTKIKNLLSIFHNDVYFKDINKIANKIKDLNEKAIYSYKNEKRNSAIQEIKKHKSLCDLIEGVKDFMLFKVIYDETLGIDQEKRFNDAVSKLGEIKDLFDKNEKIDAIYEKNRPIFDKIKNLLSNDEKKIEEFIEQIKNYYHDSLKDKQELIQDLTLLLKKSG